MRFLRAALIVIAAVSIQIQPAFCVDQDLPNILIVLADDLGFSDLGCYGGEIDTPNLDALAANGIRMTNFYNTGRCWPTRASLLTGYYAQQIGRDRLPGIQRGGTRAKRPGWAKLLPELLKHEGYRAYQSGKWHIDGTPLQGGFDQSYRTSDHGRFFTPKRHSLNDKPLPPVAADAGYYATTAIAERTIEFLQDHTANHSGKPFLSYVAFTAPHFPLHALPSDIEKYKTRYDAGWDVIRQQRWDRIRKLGLLKGELSQVESEVGPPYHFADALKKFGPAEINRPVPWNDLTDEQKQFQSDKMVLHAAMVHRMDIEIGRIISELRKLEQLDNTLVLFLSDNGASAEMMVRDDGHDPAATPGSAATHLCLGPGWSTVCNTPFRRHKTWVHEGGIATPMIVHWPDKLAERKGSFCESTAHVIDVVPTIFQMIGDRKKQLQSENKHARPGRSLLPLWQGEKIANEPGYWWLHDGHRAIRQGKWKLVSASNEPWALYDLSTDRCETKNLAESNADTTISLKTSWQQLTDQFIEIAKENFAKAKK